LPGLELQPQSKPPQLIAAVCAYWERKRGTAAWPRRQDILPAEIKQWLPRVLLVEAIDGGADFRYRLAGSQLREFFPVEPSGKIMSEVLAPFGKATVRKTLETYRSVLSMREPLRIKGDGAWYEQSLKYFEAVLAPLSEDGVTVNMIFGAFDFLWARVEAATREPAGDDAWNTALALLG
jgi:hypothetical protein